MVRRAWRAVLLAVLVLGGLGACGESTRDGDGPDLINVAGRGGTFGGSGGASGGTSAGSPPIAGFTCFEAGSLVATPTGTVPIEQLAIGDSVLAFDEQAGAVTPRRVKATFAHRVEKSGRLPLSDGRVLRVTAEHPIYDAGLGSYVRADAFGANRALVTLSQSLAPRALSSATSLDDVKAPSVALARTASDGFLDHAPGSPVTVFNISVEGLENYFVEGVLVHNKSPPLCPPMVRRMWPGGACESQAACISQTSPEVENVPINQLVPATDGPAGAGGAANGAGGAPRDTNSGGAPDATSGAPMQLGGAPGDASAGSPGAAGAAPADENAAISAPICPPEAGLPTYYLLAVDYLMPESPTTQTGFAIYTGEACSGVLLGEVVLNDSVPPPAGSLTRQCVYIAPMIPGPLMPSIPLSTNLSVHSLDPQGVVKGLRFATSCEHTRSLRTSTPTVANPAGFPCF